MREICQGIARTWYPFGARHVIPQESLTWGALRCVCRPGHKLSLKLSLDRLSRSHSKDHPKHDTLHKWRDGLRAACLSTEGTAGLWPVGRNSVSSQAHEGKA